MSVNTYTEGSGKPIVIYHSNCADGFSAAWVFWHFLRNEVEYYPGVYNDEPPADVKGRVIYLVDFSYKPEVLEKMFENGVQAIHVIDHHKTAIEMLTKWETELEQRNVDWWSRFCPFYSLDMSGATLAWDWHNQGIPAELQQPRPVLLGHIEDRDLWRFKLPLTREIQANVFSYEYTFENWDKLMSMNEAELMQFSVAGAALERKHRKDIKELIGVVKRPMYIGGHYVPVASLPYTLTSDAGHLMASEYEKGTMFAACYWDTAEHRIFSLRSCDNGMDVSAIAAEYGGGGHKHAAGFRVSRDHILAQR